ncbi:PilZ domain-containing protein [Pseudoxanthomonas sp. NC8]|nr:PilZ domain-containing protein [Pseudoxanthomonas sp. NC8]
MNPSWPAAARTADTALFDDTLACEAVLPAEFVPGASPGQLLQAEALLHGLTYIEDLRGEDGGEEKRGELPALAQRMDAKLDLVLALLGRLVRQSAPQLPTLPLRWSARGLRCLTFTRSRSTILPAPPAWSGCSRRNGCRTPQLPATVAASATVDGQPMLWLRFGTLPVALEEALERHLFRMHRREVAARRR